MLPCYQPVVMLQDNLKDCGIFVLEYIESFLNDPEFILKNIEVKKIIYIYYKPLKLLLINLFNSSITSINLFIFINI